jgi:hypothetical protein
MVLKRFNPYFLSIMLIGQLALLEGCGKKEQNPSEGSSQNSSRQRERLPQVTDIEEYLSKQDVICPDGEACPSYLVKIVAFEDNIPKICTGFLVNPETVATSSSCLPKLLRLAGQNCSEDVTFFFPKTYSRSFERVACDSVLMASDLPAKDPIFWRDDVAYLNLKKPIYSRRNLAFDRNGIDDSKDYQVWGMDQVDDKSAIIRRLNCEGVHHSYVNPFASKSTSPNMLFAGCSIKKSMTGAAILDGRGRVRGMVSVAISEGIRSYIESTGLLTDPLKEMFHASNFACSPLIFDSSVEDERECTKVMDSATLDGLRRDILKNDDHYEDFVSKFENALSGLSRYLNFSVSLNSSGDFKEMVVAPKCFKNVSKWINSLDTSRGNYSFQLSLPKKILKRTINSKGIFGAQELEDGKQDVFFQFSAKQLKKNQKSYIYMWNSQTQTETNTTASVCE